MTEYAIGLDLGGTNFRAAAVDRQGKILERIGGPTGDSREDILGGMVTAIERLREHRPGDELAGIGVAIAGFIHMEKGLILTAPNIPAFADFPARDALQDRLKAPVVLENDANAAAIGEKWIGAGRDVDDLILLTLGTGIGGGIIAGGRVVHGSQGMAGEMGHITVNPTGNPCACGNIGCLEKHASATAITTMARMLYLGDDLTSEEVYKLALGGSDAAKRVFQCMGSALGIGLATFDVIFNFPLYLLGGGVLPAWDFFAPAMFAELEQRSFTFRSTHPRVEKALLGSEAGLFGSAYTAFLEKDQEINKLRDKSNVLPGH